MFNKSKPEPKTEEIKPVDNRTDEVKFLEFFGNLSIWTPPKKTKWSRLTKIFGGGTSYKTCVFVADGEEPRVAYVPSEPSLKVLRDGERIYDKATEGDVLFYHRDMFLPIVNARPMDKMYDVPEHEALALYNRGLNEGKSIGMSKLIQAVRSMKFIQTALIIGIIITVVGAIMITKSYGEAVENITGYIGGLEGGV